jgi:hypothetical protein
VPQPRQLLHLRHVSLLQFSSVPPAASISSILSCPPSCIYIYIPSLLGSFVRSVRLVL